VNDARTSSQQIELGEFVSITRFAAIAFSAVAVIGASATVAQAGIPLEPAPAAVAVDGTTTPDPATSGSANLGNAVVRALTSGSASGGTTAPTTPQ
jgi:hypothetical protein